MSGSDARRVTLIAAVAANGVIGRDGDLAWRSSEDLRRFKALTLGHVLVMGRKTYDSIGRALPGRTTVVVTRQSDWAAVGVLVAGSVEDALARAAVIDHEVFVAGGGEVYAGALEHATRLEITHVDADLEGDVHFPRIDALVWRETAREQRDGFAWVTYARC
ncbi:MAG: dihydrofolate reductase [Nocardioidaceae bacterium]